MTLPEPEERAARERVHMALHALWTKAVDQPGYNKREWCELDNAIVRAFCVIARIHEDRRRQGR